MPEEKNHNGRVSWETVQEKEIAAIKAFRSSQNSQQDVSAKPRENLVGLAISGGGIRSATFSLGILEALKQKGILTKIDYMSTVSGGGYIGSWLSANCYRHGSQWLTKEADWIESIKHLRRYSNYLSPELKILSADTWSMATIWLRNTLLVQAIIILTIAVLLLFPRHLFWVLDIWPKLDHSHLWTSLLFIVGAALIILNLIDLQRDQNISKDKEQNITNDKDEEEEKAEPFWHGLTFNQTNIQFLVFFFLGLGLLVATLLWHQVKAHPAEYKTFLACLSTLWRDSYVYLLLYYFTLLFYARSSSKGNSLCKPIVWLAPLPTVGLLSLLMAIILRVLHGWHGQGDEGQWLAFMWAPPMVMFAFSMAIIILIGMLGRQSYEYIREWWSRFGAWLAIYGFSWMVIVSASIYGPLLCEILYFHASWKLLSTGWLGTTIAGIMAGRSVATGSTSQIELKPLSTRIQEIIAKIAPYAFILGLLILIAFALHLFLVIIAEGDILIDNLMSPDFLADRHWQYLSSDKQLGALLAATLVCVPLLYLLAWRVDINEFSLNAFYRTRLARCYLGATRFQPKERNPNIFTGFDDDDDIKLHTLVGLDNTLVGTDKKLYGPLHIINCALNLGGSSDLALHTRHSNNFILTPLYCGSTYEVKDLQLNKQEIGFIETEHYCGEVDQPTLGQAISVSGAAASPNMGYHTSQAVSFLMTIFNARLGWWFPSPLKEKYDQASPKFCLDYLVQELFGTADEHCDFLAISDGGHFENLAAYELIRRQCKVVIVCDGECDPNLQFEGLAKLIRLCEVDRLAKIDIDVSAIKPDKTTGWSQSRCVVGKINYEEYAEKANKDQKANISNIKDGWLIYIKASMTGNEDTAILQYKSTHPTFPHETTSDQFFNEDQFESYRLLGKDIAGQIFAKWDIEDSNNPDQPKSEITSWNMDKIAAELYDILSPELINHTMFIHQADKLIELWKQLSEDENLKDFDTTFDNIPMFNFCNQIIQFMENVYLSLNLEETWHTDSNKGWMELFKEWAKNPHVDSIWKATRHTYGIKFKSFWDRRLKPKKLQ